MDAAQITSALSRARPARKPQGELPLVFFTVLAHAAGGSAWIAKREEV